jgi:hypothetical protein
MSTPVESLKDSIRQAVSSMKRDAPAARFIGEQVIKMLSRSVIHKLNDLTHTTREQENFDTTGTEPMVGAVSPVEAGSSEVLPWPHYDVMSARDIISQLTASPPEVRAAVNVYERRHRARATVLAASQPEGNPGTP